MDIQKVAKEFRGNWIKFNSFSWSRSWGGDLEHPENYGIFYTINRDSNLMTESNAKAIDEMFKRYVDRRIVLPEHHNHWACGWIDGYSIPVYRHNKTKFTSAFLLYCEIQSRLEDYPLLDEEDYYERVYNQTIKNCIESVKYHNKAGEYKDKRQQKIIDYLVSNAEGDDYYPSNDDIDNAIEQTKRGK